jgi:hypothetical protein
VISAYSSQNINISFDRKVSSEENWDYLKYYIDGVKWEDGWSGIVAWGNVTYSLSSPGLHEYLWCYSKDFNLNEGSDAAWIDNISITTN